jgi:predicted ATPase
MASDAPELGEDGGFHVGLTASPSFCEIVFEHFGGAALNTELRLGILVNGVAQAGDGLDLGNKTGDVRSVLYDPARIDGSSVQSDYTAGLASGTSFAVFLVWRARPNSPQFSAVGVRGEHSEDGSFQLESRLAGRDAVDFLVSAGLDGQGTFTRSVDASTNTGASNAGPSTPGVLVAPTQEAGSPDSEHLPAYFTELSVSGFRGFADGRSLRFARPNGDEGSGLTILVGANNSGKSTFLEALHSIARGREQGDLSFPQPRRHRDLDVVTLELTRSDSRKLQVQSIRKGGSQAQPKWLPEGLGPDKFDIHVTPSRRNFSPYFGNTGATDRNWGFVNAELSRTELREQFVGRLRKVDREPVARLEFDRLLTEILGYPLNWTIDEVSPNQQFLKLVESDGAWHTSEGLGDGLVSMLFIVDALYDSDPGALIAIDEPELSLHPQLVRRLGRVLSRYSADRQIVVATHSPLIIDWSDIAHGATIARVFKRDGHSEIAQATDEALRKIAGFTELRNLSNPHIVGSVAREAFFLEDGVILTEGQDDVTYLARVFDDLELPRPDNIYGWGAGGASNIPHFARLFIELGFSKIGAILDEDGQSNTEEAVRELQAMAPKVLVRQIPAPDIRYKREVQARSEVVGLLDKDNRHVRPELRESAYIGLRDILDHVLETESLGGPA